MKRQLALGTIVALAAIVGLARPILADDVFITTSFAQAGIGSVQYYEHNDLDPFKGSATITVTNDSSEDWGALNLYLFSVPPNPVKAIFVDTAPAFTPTSTHTISGWNIDNLAVGGPTMDVYFLSDPILVGQTATLKVYTDNTATQKRFGLAIYPTPVPEPGSLLAMSVALTSFVGLVMRKKS